MARRSRPKTSTRPRALVVALGLLSGLFVTACDLETKAVTMRIDHYRDPCWGAGPEFCLRVLESSDPDVSMPSRIDGFDHDWGFVYEIEVAVHDASSSSDVAYYDLLQVVSRESVAAGSTFTLPLTGDYIARVDGARFDLVGGLSAECADVSVCKAVADALRSDTRFSVDLSYPAAPGKPLVAHAVTMGER